MNKIRRKKLQDLHDRIYQLNIELNEVKDEEQEAFDNMPESLLNSAKGETMQDDLSKIVDVVGYLDDAANGLEDFFN